MKPNTLLMFMLDSFLELELIYFKHSKQAKKKKIQMMTREIYIYIIWSENKKSKVRDTYSIIYIHM